MAQPKLVSASTTPVIEKGVPLPISRGGSNSCSILRLMEINDSIFFAGRTAASISGWAVRVGKDHNMKFTCRTVEGSVRVWRIA